MSMKYAMIVRKNAAFPSVRGAAFQTTALTTVLATDSIVILAGEKVPMVAVRSGVLIGDIYRRQGAPKPISEIDAATAERLAEGKFDQLLSTYWGSYVGAVATMNGPIIFRDPSATCPCYFTATAQHIVFASDIRTLIDISGLDVNIDWGGVADYLYAFGLPSTRTALTGVSELLPGTSITIGETAQIVRPIWLPWDHVSRRQGASAAENAEALRETLYGCVAALTHRIERPLISVSGGLDSSIIAACVYGTGKKPAGLTMFTKDIAGDERSYAGTLCDAFGYPLVACAYSIDEINIDVPVSPHLPRPIGRTIALAYEKALIENAKLRDADAFLTGNGGDNIFANLRSAKPIIDRLLSEGWSTSIWSTLRDVATLTGASYWQVGRAALKAFRIRNEAYHWKANTRFLHPDIVSERAEGSFEHYWLKGPDTALPGQRVHIAGLLRLQQTLEPIRTAHAPVISPFVAQPLTELCLSIPTWQWCSGGRDRAVARLAFSGVLPSEILDRRVKGTPDSFSAQIIGHFRGAIRERLLDGRLADYGLLDRTSLQAALEQGPIARAEDRPRLLDLLDTEAWIAHWLDGVGAGSEPDAASARSLSQ
jgi:asparagine synthase (glutamine-hydrolysing)